MHKSIFLIVLSVLSVCKGAYSEELARCIDIDKGLKRVLCNNTSLNNPASNMDRYTAALKVHPSITTEEYSQVLKVRKGWEEEIIDKCNIKDSQTEAQDDQYSCIRELIRPQEDKLISYYSNEVHEWEKLEEEKWKIEEKKRIEEANNQTTEEKKAKYDKEALASYYLAFIGAKNCAQKSYIFSEKDIISIQDNVKLFSDSVDITKNEKDKIYRSQYDSFFTIMSAWKFTECEKHRDFISVAIPNIIKNQEDSVNPF